MDSLRSLTVAICTQGEAPHLTRALASVARQQLPDGVCLEILCIDNNPEPAVTMPDARHVRVIHEPQPGLSRARNTALDHACGDAVAFIDDDAVAEPDWAAELLRAFEATGAWCVGGRVLPEWPGTPPAWLSPRLEYLLSLLDFGDNMLRLKGPLFPCGTNLALRRWVTERAGDFDVRLGRRPESLLSGEETHLFRRVLRAGGSIAYAPKAVVRHVIPTSRLTTGHLRLRARWEGRTFALVDRLDRGLPFAVASALLRTGLSLLREPLTALGGILAGKGPELAICRALKTIGYWEGLAWPLDESHS